ncbi:unnamed protein product [Fusarium graminearum]|uniref:Uncharacterized protein n=1 Tax=Gibberella zeae TaxID=5518 RepID=A0A4E9E036_GIBZA|nr:unnamed protein product [Fusarium graminearum]CAF3630222.1 unnamed protein product [Fusarium graminearum]CAG1992649.1 unnamed protein product [Fusarium graminearum]
MLPWQDSKSLILESDLRLSMLPEEEAPRARAGIDSLMGLYCLVPTSGDQKCMQGFFAYPSHQIQSKFAVSQSNLGSSHSCLSYTHPTTSRVEDRTLSRNGVQIFLVQPVDPVDTCESCSDACRAKLDCLIHDECQFCVLCTWIVRDVESNYRARDVCIPMQGVQAHTSKRMSSLQSRRVSDSQSPASKLPPCHCFQTTPQQHHE